MCVSNLTYLLYDARSRPTFLVMYSIQMSMLKRKLLMNSIFTGFLIIRPETNANMKVFRPIFAKYLKRKGKKDTRFLIGYKYRFHQPCAFLYQKQEEKLLVDFEFCMMNQ